MAILEIFFKWKYDGKVNPPLFHYAVNQFVSSSDENRSVRTSFIKFLLHSGANPQNINEDEKSDFRILTETSQSNTHEWHSFFLMHA